MSLGGHRGSCYVPNRYDARPMEITWYGRACFRLKGKDATVITDPCPPSTGFVAGKHDVDLLVTAIRTYHDGEAGKERGENMIFSFEVDGVHICHLGDLGHLLTDEQVHELGPIDVLLVPIGGGTTLTPAEAAEVVSQIGPKIVIPMHFAVDGGSPDLGAPDKFLHEMATEPIRQPKAQVTPNSLPDETHVVLLEARGRTS